MAWLLLQNTRAYMTQELRAAANHFLQRLGTTTRQVADWVGTRDPDYEQHVRRDVLCHALLASYCTDDFPGLIRRMRESPENYPPGYVSLLKSVRLYHSYETREKVTTALQRLLARGMVFGGPTGVFWPSDYDIRMVKDKKTINYVYVLSLIMRVSRIRRKALPFDSSNVSAYAESLARAKGIANNACVGKTKQVNLYKSKNWSQATWPHDEEHVMTIALTIVSHIHRDEECKTRTNFIFIEHDNGKINPKTAVLNWEEAYRDSRNDAAIQQTGNTHQVYTLGLMMDMGNNNLQFLTEDLYTLITLFIHASDKNLFSAASSRDYTFTNYDGCLHLHNKTTNMNILFPPAGESTELHKLLYTDQSTDESRFHDTLMDVVYCPKHKGLLQDQKNLATAITDYVQLVLVTPQNLQKKQSAFNSELIKGNTATRLRKKILNLHQTILNEFQ